ncbi:MAG: hypothetical protein HQK52_05130 [Oligoflexia bacterium]|nr:hypothetical protein [Oligoflexia bacterium]
MNIKVILFITSLALMPLAYANNNFENGQENCETPQGLAAAAKSAALLSCKWIEALGSGKAYMEKFRNLKDIKDIAERKKILEEFNKKAFALIMRNRHCKNNYVWIESYAENLTKDSPADLIRMLLHPVKPGLETNLDLTHKEYYGYKIFEQFNISAEKKPAGCWVPYKWTLQGTEGQVDKISYVVRCKDKDDGKFVVAGAGFYAPHKTIPEKEQCSMNPHPFN